MLDALIWKKKSSIPTTTNRFYPPDDFSYPHGIAYLLKFFSNDAEKFVWLNIILNILEVIVIFAFIYCYLDKHVAILFLLLTAIMPSILSPWYGLYGVNARNIGAITCTLYILCIVLSFYDFSIYYTLPLQISLIILSILFSQFAVQSIIVISLFSAIWFVSFVPLIPLILTITVLKLLNFQQINRILYGHYQHVKFYKNFLQYYAVATIHRNKSIHEIITGFYRQKDLKKFVMSFPLLRLIIFYPILPIYIISIIIYGQTNILEFYAMGLVIMNTALCLVIPLKGWRFLGEADRYFMFGSNYIVTAALAGIFYRTENIVATLVLCAFFSLSYLILIKVRLRYNTETGLQKNELSVLEFLKSSSRDNATVLCVPTNISDKLAVFTKNKFVGIHTNVNPDEHYWAHYKTIYERNLYPYPDLSNKSFLMNSDVGIIVVSKKFTSKKYLQSNGYPSEVYSIPHGYSKVIENQSFIVLQRQTN